MSNPNGYYDRDRNPRSPTTGIPSATPTSMGTMNHPITHHGNVAEYQASGIPFAKKITLTQNVRTQLKFPYVTQWVEVIIENDHAVEVAFAEKGLSTATASTNNHVLIDGGSVSGQRSFGGIWRLKCNQLWFLTGESGGANIYVIAGLTNVPYEDFPNISGIVGVGA